MDRQYCVLDKMKKALLRLAVESSENEIKKSRESYPLPEKKSPRAKYETESVLEESCITDDGLAFVMESFRPVTDTGKKLPAVIVIRGIEYAEESRISARDYHDALARRGYLVYSFDYKAPDDTSMLREIRDTCGIFKIISERIKVSGADMSNVFIAGTSAGAYPALYIAAMCRSEKLRRVIGCDAPELKFTALGIHGGLFYIDRCDPVGWLMSTAECSKSKEDREFQKYANPECDEVIKNLPPVFMTTSRGDFLNDYTLSYHEALKKAGRKSHLVYFGDQSLFHAFPAIIPNRAESIDAIDKMTVWFEEQA